MKSDAKPIGVEPCSRPIRFGWQGVAVSVPSTWELNAHQGDWRAGFASLDDGLATRLRMRWETEGRRAADVDVALDVYVRSLRKRLGRQTAIETVGPEFLPKRFREDHAVRVFGWHAQDSAFGMVWRCGRRRRMHLMEVLFPGATAEEPTGRPLARRILGSVEDHRADGQALWAVYGLVFEIPERYRLGRADFVPGRLRLPFSTGPRTWLRVERWAAASQWMKGLPLARMPEEWLRASRLVRRGALRQESLIHHGHEAVRFDCTVRGRLLRPPRLAGLLWVCPPEDRVYAVAVSDAPDGELECVATATHCG